MALSEEKSNTRTNNAPFDGKILLSLSPTIFVRTGNVNSTTFLLFCANEPIVRDNKKIAINFFIIIQIKLYNSFSNSLNASLYSSGLLKMPFMIRGRLAI